MDNEKKLTKLQVVLRRGGKKYEHSTDVSNGLVQPMSVGMVSQAILKHAEEAFENWDEYQKAGPYEAGTQTRTKYSVYACSEDFVVELFEEEADPNSKEAFAALSNKVVAFLSSVPSFPASMEVRQ